MPVIGGRRAASNFEDTPDARRALWPQEVRHEVELGQRTSFSTASAGTSQSSVVRRLERDGVSSRPTAGYRQAMALRIVEQIRPPTIAEFVPLLQEFGTESDNNWYLRSLAGPNFGKVLQEVLDWDRTKIQRLSWEKLWDHFNFDTYNFLNDGNVQTVDSSVYWIERMLDYNHIDYTSFVKDVYEIVNRVHSKKNSLWLYGPPNCGKSLIVNSIAGSLIYPAALEQPDPRGARFVYSNLVRARAGVLNECKIYSNVADKMLLLLEGGNVETDAKFKDQANIRRVPLLITSNSLLWNQLPGQYDKQRAIEERVTRYNMQTFPELINCHGSLHPMAWKHMVETYLREQTFGDLIIRNNFMPELVDLVDEDFE